MTQINTYSQKVMQYEDETLRAVALSLIPDNIQAIGDQVAQLKALLKWFKSEFFTWCDKPQCDKCGTNQHCEACGMAEPTAFERGEGQASRVEAYKCATC